jgi:predicted transcriptional regulator
MSKRPDGTLEHDVLAVLWRAGTALQPAEVQQRLPGNLAYTSVATILGRLHTKGLVSRRAVGRAFAYEAAVPEPELAARRINDILSSTDDRTAALAGFVGTLSNRDRDALRALLGESAL